MARKKKNEIIITEEPDAEIRYQPITETIETNYMPYVMSVIVSRAIPNIDGFKPSHRKILYTMYKMGLLNGPRQKSSNVVGQTMQYHPHGDMAIYETLVRLTRGHEALLHPFVDSKGSFGKQYSRDMAFAASRYTEVKLDKFCQELFAGIDKNAVDMIPNYDNTKTEPLLLPTTFPNILISPNLGIAVGMACSICSFNLNEICDGTIALLRNPKTTTERMMELIKAPDFPCGGLIIYDKEKIKTVYETGVGGIRIRAKYAYDAKNNSIEILEIPYSTSIEVIMSKITDLVREKKLPEITDMRDSIDRTSAKLITIDLKKGIDPDKLMAKLYKLTTLEDNFDCNFNILVNNSPRQMGIAEILTEWIKFRTECLTRETEFDLGKKSDKLHLLRGLAKILLDIDKAVKIVRLTEAESDVVPNLMKAFSLTEVQAEYVAEIKLRHLNREYILNRISEIENLTKEIDELKLLLSDEGKMREKIINQLKDIKKNYGKPRRSEIISVDDIVEAPKEELFVENYKVKVIMTKEGYFKKITPQSLRGNDEQKLKENDFVLYDEDTDNATELIFLTDKAQVYKCKAADFELCKASALGEYIPAKLKMDANEKPILCKAISSYDEKQEIAIFFENGKAVRISVKHYETKSNRKKLTSAFYDGSSAVGAVFLSEPCDIIVFSSNNKAITINSSLLPFKSTRTSFGSTAFTLTAKNKLVGAYRVSPTRVEAAQKYKKRKIPAVGSPLSEDEEFFHTVK